VAAYLTRLRMKEVAVRKVLGASVTGLLARLNREFVGLVGVAFVLGSGAAYLAMDRWLTGFATRITVSPLVFLGVGLGALALAVGAVSWQSLKAARVDPATVLRAE
jgi:putative ABC transport system permease protein